MIKILMIGNSFGQDSLRYLHGIFRAAGINSKVVNLYIGGCSLYRHYRNMLSEENAYEYEINGYPTGLHVSLKDALLSDEWDYVGLQQCSPKSGDPDSYLPFLPELCAYVRRLVPHAKICINKTWTFAHECPRFGLTAFSSPEEMLPAIDECYEKAAMIADAHILIPSGDAMALLYEKHKAAIYRDGFHCNKGFTRYMLGCVWYMSITGNSIVGNSFRDLDVPTDESLIEDAQDAAITAVVNAGLLD